MLTQVRMIYGRVAAHAGAMAESVRFWFALAFASGMLAVFMQRAVAAGQTGKVDVLMYVGHALLAYALLMAWYTLHRYLITKEQPPSASPQGLVSDSKAFEFVMAQVRNTVLLVLLSLVFLSPLTFYIAFNAPYAISQEEVVETQRRITLVAVPLIVIFFARLLLVAPFAARGIEEAVRRSWRATRGHFLRINGLQLFCLLPAILGSTLAYGLGLLGRPEALVVGVVLDVAGTMASLALFAELAEQEYAKLVTDKAEG